MGTPEGKVKDFVDRLMKTWFPNAIKYSPPGMGRFGRNGMPDRIWWIKKSDEECITVVIETKKLGEEPTPIQMKNLLRFKDIGAIAAVVAGKDQEKMEVIRAEILCRLQLADEEPRPSTIQTPNSDD